MTLKALHCKKLALITCLGIIVGSIVGILGVHQALVSPSVTVTKQTPAITSSPEATAAPHHFLVKYTPTSKTALENAYAELGVKMKTELASINTDIVENPPSSGISDTDFETKLRATGVSVERDQTVSTMTVPNDPYYSIQWGPTAIKADTTWNTNTGSPSVTIAFVDTGADMTHPDLTPNLLSTGYNFVAGTSDPSDDNGHGTHVAGIAAADGNNSIGVAGVCWQCKIMPVKVLDASGSGTTSTVAAGILYATDHGAQIINLSLGSSTGTQIMSDAIQYAISHNVVVVAAAGNSGSSSPIYPAAYPGVISVASAGQTGQLSSFSNYGSWVSVVAPGESIASTYKKEGYAYLSGTSMASPFVAGEAGLLLSQNPSLSPAQVKSKIVGSTDPITSYIDSTNGSTHSVNGGEIDVLAAVNPTTTPAPPPTATPTTAPTAVPAQIKAPSDLPELGTTPDPNQATPAPALVITKPPVNGVASTVPQSVIPKPTPKKAAPTPSPSPTPSPTPAPSPSPTPRSIAVVTSELPAPTVKALSSPATVTVKTPEKDSSLPWAVGILALYVVVDLGLLRGFIHRFLNRLTGKASA
ncbi:MAG: S8 family peptidase [bacterium]